MRLEIIVPDSTRPELKARLAKITQQLSENPELAEEFLLDEEDAIQRMFTTERLAHIDRAIADVKAGRFVTGEQIEEHFARKEADWTRSHPA